MQAIGKELGEVRPPEYQAVLIVDHDDGRMFPLTEDCPKCLLPVSNRKLIAYQLDMLAKSGAEGRRVIFFAFSISLYHFVS
jgi:UTP-glucose-1-phosphate uridylyltransferase